MREVVIWSSWPSEELKEDRAKPGRCTSHRGWHILRTFGFMQWSQ